MALRKQAAELRFEVKREPKKIQISDFKARCLSLLDKLSPEGLVITKHGKPVATVTPMKKKHPMDHYGILSHLDLGDVHEDLRRLRARDTASHERRMQRQIKLLLESGSIS
jgi:prevent-host-death family protein